MKAVVFRSKDEPLQISEVEKPVLKAGEVLVKLYYAALNHLDIWIWKEQRPDKPVISGSDGSGIVHDVANDEDSVLIGKEVIINPSLYWGDNENFYGNDFQILGNPTNGSFAEYIAINREYVYQKPDHLTLKEAAALPLASLTAYRALFTKVQLTAKDKVLITGIGGGAALYLLQMAVAVGASVFVTSSSGEKIEKAIESGATGGYNYKNANWIVKAKKDIGGFDVIIDSAGGNGFTSLLDVANPAARIILFGRTAGNINNINPSAIYNKHLQISGTVMGTQNEFEAMLRFYQRHQLHPTLDKEFSLDQIDLAYQYMNSGSQFGKIILKIA